MPCVGQQRQGMNGEADDDFYDDEGEVQHDTDHKGPVDAGQVDGMVVVTEAVGMVVIAMAVAVAAMIVDRRGYGRHGYVLRGYGLRGRDCGRCYDRVPVP
jgi:hypothetical protein